MVESKSHWGSATQEGLWISSSSSYKGQGILRLKKMKQLYHSLPMFRSLPIQWKGDRKQYSCNRDCVLKMKFGHRDCLPDFTPQFHPVHISFILVLTNCFVELKKNLAVMANAPCFSCNSVSQSLWCCGPGDAESITAGTSWMCLSGQTCQCWKWFGLALPHSQISFRTSKQGFVWAGSIHIVLTRNKTSSHLGSNCLTHLVNFSSKHRLNLLPPRAQTPQDDQEKVIFSCGNLPSCWILIQGKLWTLLELQMWASYFQVFPNDTCALKGNFLHSLETTIMSGMIIPEPLWFQIKEFQKHS